MTTAPLPEPLPDDPLPLVETWIADAARTLRNPTAMALATVEPTGRPTVRMVLCRGFDVAAGWFVFYTDRESPKGRDLASKARAAAAFYWEPLSRQVRVDGPVTLAPDADTDRYWRTRPLDARIAAAATVQSRPIGSRRALLARVEETERRFDGDVPRPDRWIGYRVWAERVELWVSQPARVHDRAVWVRPLDPTTDGFKGGAWSATRLEP